MIVYIFIIHVHIVRTVKMKNSEIFLPFQGDFKADNNNNNNNNNNNLYPQQEERRI